MEGQQGGHIFINCPLNLLPSIRPVRPPSETVMGDSETIIALTGDSETTAGVDDGDTTAVMGDEETTAGMDDGDTTAVMGDEETTAGMDDEETTAVMGDEEKTAVMGNIPVNLISLQGIKIVGGQHT